MAPVVVDVILFNVHTSCGYPLTHIHHIVDTQLASLVDYRMSTNVLLLFFRQALVPSPKDEIVFHHDPSRRRKVSPLPPPSTPNATTSPD